MKYIIATTLLMASTSAFAFTKADIKTIKDAQGTYELDLDKKSTEDQKRICLEGDLVFNEEDGSLLLGGTPLASDIFTEDKKPVPSTAKPEDDCKETLTSGMTKKTLAFETKTTCPSDKTEFEIKRVIEFQIKNISYRQSHNANGEKIEVECKLKKVTSKKPKPWKVAPDEEESLIVDDSKSE